MLAYNDCIIFFLAKLWVSHFGISVTLHCIKAQEVTDVTLRLCPSPVATNKPQPIVPCPSFYSTNFLLEHGLCDVVPQGKRSSLRATGLILVIPSSIRFLEGNYSDHREWEGCACIQNVMKSGVVAKHRGERLCRVRHHDYGFCTILPTNVAIMS